MFETAELGQTLAKKEWKTAAPAMRQRLLEAQRLLLEAKFPVIVVFAGVDGAGKTESVNLLNEWMDPRWTVTHAYSKATQEEAERPEYWRYWRDLPPKGQIGLFLSAWYSRPFLDNVYGVSKSPQYERALARINTFERMLVDDGALILKFWMHLDKKGQKKRLKALEADPLTAWQVKSKDWKHWKIYDKFIDSAKTLIAKTSTAEAPWQLIEGADDRFRSMAVTEAVATAIEARLKAEAQPRRKSASKKKAAPDMAGPNVLSALDMEQRLEREEYREQLMAAQADLARLQRKAQKKGVSTAVVFEGWDAAGKGGAIRRVIHALDAQNYRVIPIAAPTDEEHAQHYLWRFWRHLPRAGRVTLFDRSWYGRVLVERVEGFASEEEWRRSYSEINEFEQEMAEADILVHKFWVHITKEEQLARFEDRKNTPYKAWKLTDEDWRNRDRWDDYQAAVDEMVARTSTAHAPWTLVEGNQKWFSRVKIARTIADRLKDRLG